MKREISQVLCLAIVVGLAFPIAVSARHIEDGALDQIDLEVESIERGVPVVIREFPSDHADLGTGKDGGKEKRTEAARTMQGIAPGMLVEAIQQELSGNPVFGEILTGDVKAPADALVIEGDFVYMNPGSKAKRYWAGFGAGKSGVGVEGRVTDNRGKVLAKFRHRKHSGIGLMGGNYIKFMSDDTKDVGHDIAKFLVKWATGGDLTDD